MVRNGLSKFAFGHRWLLPAIGLDPRLPCKVLGHVLERGSAFGDQMFYLGHRDPTPRMSLLHQAEQEIAFVFPDHRVPLSSQVGIEWKLLAQVTTNSKVGTVR